MIQPTRIPVQWATFPRPTAISGGGGSASAIAADAVTQLWIESVMGVPVLCIGGESIPKPARIPLTNVASYGL